MVSLYQTEIKKIEFNLNKELKLIDENDIHGKFRAHKVAFDEIMNLVKVYQPLLKDIKQEYESLIYHVIKAQKYTEKMQEEIKTAASYPTTIENHERHSNQLRERLHQLRKSNSHRLEKIRDVQMKCDVISKSIDKDNQPKIENNKIRRDIRRLPNMNLTDLTDLVTMQQFCRQLDDQYQQLKRTQSSKYVPKDEETKLTNQLMEQISKHDQLRIDVKSLIQKKVLIQAALKESELFQIEYHLHENIGETIVRAFVNSSKMIAKETADTGDLSIEDQIDKFFPENSRQLSSLKESDYIVLSIRKFERLFNEGKHKEAVDLAIAVPRGVLRNYATLCKFKELENHQILLYYCQQLVSTVKNQLLDEHLSFECVDCALKEGRIDLVKVWISQGRIASTDLIADNLTSYADLMPDNKIFCLELATSIYWDLMNGLTNQTDSDSSKLFSHRQLNPQSVSSRRRYFDSILECQIKSGRIQEVIDMLTNENSIPISSRSRQEMYKTEDLLLLIQFYPKFELVQSLIGKNLMSFPLAMKSLLETESYGVAAQLMIHSSSTISISDMTEQLIESIPSGISTEIWEEMLNFVNESDEKVIIEIAASYLVQLSIEKSFIALQNYEFAE